MSFIDQLEPDDSAVHIVNTPPIDEMQMVILGGLKPTPEQLAAYLTPAEDEEEMELDEGLNHIKKRLEAKWKSRLLNENHH